MINQTCERIRSRRRAPPCPNFNIHLLSTCTVSQSLPVPPGTCEEDILEVVLEGLPSGEPVAITAVHDVSGVGRGRPLDKNFLGNPRSNIPGRGRNIITYNQRVLAFINIYR